MNKIFSILIIGALLLSSFGAIASNTNQVSENEVIIKTKQANIQISNIKFDVSTENYLDVMIEDSTSYIMEPGEPMLPKVIDTFELPFGANNIQVEVTPYGISTQTVSYEVKPAPAHIPLVEASENIKISDDEIKNQEIYSSSDPYPANWYSLDVRVGLNSDNERKTFANVLFYPVKYYPNENKVETAEGADIVISYEDTGFNPFPTNAEYNLVIIAPRKFERELGRFVDHKNSLGIQTLLMTTEEIYSEYTGVDKPEQIKYFIKDAIEKYDITYVLLFGGLKSLIYAKPRDDSNQGSKNWYVPVRYNNLFDNPEHPLLAEELVFDPGVITDLYYADIYEEGGAFSTWDPNEDGYFAAWSKEGVENDIGIDMMPDVMVGRLPCRNLREVKDIVDKIIKYESEKADPSWFKRVLSISGDGFLDQQPLNIEWDTKGLEDGEYIIYDQSSYGEKKEDSPISQLDGRIYGPIEQTRVTLNKNAETKLTFNHNDYERIPGYPDQLEYPAPPIAEIVSVSDGDILGNTDFEYSPGEGEAYGNEFSGWANMSYKNGVLTINGKTYYPTPYGNTTDIHVWVENENFEKVFDKWVNNSKMYFEGEWVVGNRMLNGGGGALYYMDGFGKKYLWASNGQMHNKFDLIEEYNKGYGFVFMSGHGSPNTWGDHYPGIPGNRLYGGFGGMTASSIRAWPPFFKIPVYPMNSLENEGKPSVTLIGGCHNSQFNVSFMTTLLDYVFPDSYKMWTHGFLVPECFSWHMLKLKDRGAIATLGNTGLGYGILGEDCLIGGLDGGICIMFFEQYSKLKDGNDNAILGKVYQETLSNYVLNFVDKYNPEDSEFDDHVKTLHQWVLLGDPTLMIGGYPS